MGRPRKAGELGGVMIEAEKTYEHVLFEQDGAVAYVTMNRPKKRNVLSLEHMRELISLFEEMGERRNGSPHLESRSGCSAPPRWSHSPGPSARKDPWRCSSRASLSLPKKPLRKD